MKPDELKKLLRTLGRELFQTETSAVWHGRREARRLGAVPPAWALAGVADHAEGVLRQLPGLAKQHDMPASGGGHLTGRLFSAARHLVADRFIDTERSYRGTLLGMRHGIDLVHMLRHVAKQLGDRALVDWCRGWIDVRSDLVARVEEELAWFAKHPDAARARPGRARMEVVQAV
jgi:hypothetical protein